MLHVFTSFLGGGSIVYSLWIVQWDFTRRDHLENPGRVSGSGLVNFHKDRMSHFHIKWLDIGELN